MHLLGLPWLGETNLDNRADASASDRAQPQDYFRSNSYSRVFQCLHLALCDYQAGIRSESYERLSQQSPERLKNNRLVPGHSTAPARESSSMSR